MNSRRCTTSETTLLVNHLQLELNINDYEELSYAKAHSQVIGNQIECRVATGSKKISIPLDRLAKYY